MFDSDPFVLNLKNGLLDLRTYELKPHTPDYPSLSQLPVTYDPRANCPRFQQFLDEVLYKGDDVPLQEFVGAMLWAEPLQKVILLDGTGSNGKGTFIGIIKAILGEANICARSLQDLEFNHVHPLRETHVFCQQNSRDVRRFDSLLATLDTDHISEPISRSSRQQESASRTYNATGTLRDPELGYSGIV